MVLGVLVQEGDRRSLGAGEEGRGLMSCGRCWISSEGGWWGGSGGFVWVVGWSQRSVHKGLRIQTTGRSCFGATLRGRVGGAWRCIWSWLRERVERRDHGGRAEGRWRGVKDLQLGGPTSSLTRVIPCHLGHAPPPNNWER